MFTARYGLNLYSWNWSCS